MAISKLFHQPWLSHMSYSVSSLCIYSFPIIHVVVCLIIIFWSKPLFCVMSQMVNLCKLCSKKVQSFSHYLQCVNCLWKCHTKCMGMNVDDVMICPWNSHKWYRSTGDVNQVRNDNITTTKQDKTGFVTMGASYVRRSFWTNIRQDCCTAMQH